MPRARQDADGDQVIQLRLQDVWPKARSLKNRRGTAVVLLGKPDQDMLRADVIVAQALGLLIGQPQDLPGALGELLKHAGLLPGSE